MNDDSERARALAALEEIRRRLAVADPEVLAAADEMDRSLVRLCLEKSPMERLRLGISFARGLSRFGEADGRRD